MLAPETKHPRLHGQNAGPLPGCFRHLSHEPGSLLHRRLTSFTTPLQHKAKLAAIPNDFHQGNRTLTFEGLEQVGLAPGGLETFALDATPGASWDALS